MIYSEEAYFNGAPVQHMADREESQRQDRIRKDVARIRRRAAREWAQLDGRTALQHSRDTLAAMSPERRAQLHAEWI